MNFSLAFSSYGIRLVVIFTQEFLKIFEKFFRPFWQLLKSLWMPTLFAMMEKHPSASFCQSIQEEAEEQHCNNSDTGQYIDSMIFSMIQLPGKILELWQKRTIF